jgi:hypothetical protein
MGTASTIIAPPRRSPMNPTIRMPSAWGFCRKPAVANSTVPVSGSDRGGGQYDINLQACRKRLASFSHQGLEKALASACALVSAPRQMTQASPLGNRKPGQLDGKDASLIGQVARIDAATIRFDAPSTEGEPQAQAGAIRMALLERAE